MLQAPQSVFRVEILTRPTYWYCEPGWEWQSRPLPNFLLWYVLDGVGKMRINDASHDLQAGSCFVFPPDSQPHGTQDPDRRLVVFGMDFATIASEQATLASPAAVAPPHGHVVRDMAFFSTLVQHCDASYRRGDAMGMQQSAVWLQAMILQVWDEVLHPPPSVVDLVLEEIVRDLQMEPGKRRSVEDLAAQAHLSRAQFVRRFRSATGLSPTRFMIQARLERARHLIQETAMTLGQIAEVLGYEDVFFFSRQYKHYAGYPPSDLRRS